MRTRHPTRGKVLLLWVAVSGCATSAPEPRISAVAIADRASELCARAGAVEPSITPLLQALAARYGARLAKLDKRLKSPASTARKLHKELVESPRKRLRDIALSDLVRYTLVVSDEPPGHHVDTIRNVIAALEREGHRLLELKNYWPPGDPYSGVNAVFADVSGLWWELQFHTPSSLDTLTHTRDPYERLRGTGTPLREKQELYRSMSQVWETVAIPAGMLQGALHGKEALMHIPLPR